MIINTLKKVWDFFFTDNICEHNNVTLEYSDLDAEVYYCADCEMYLFNDMFSRDYKKH